MVKVLRPRSIKLPPTPFARFRLLFLVLALVGAVSRRRHGRRRRATRRSSAPRASCCSLGLAAYWVHGYRRSRFSLALEPLEAGAVFVILHVTPGDPLLPLARALLPQPLRRPAARVGPLRRCGWARSSARTPAAAPEQFDGDLSRAMGTALAPILGQSLFAALRASEIIQRRLTSIVQNSTDVVTIVGEDLRVRWQAASIRGVLAQDPDAIVGTPSTTSSTRTTAPRSTATSPRPPATPTTRAT